jgi:polyisoprenoid-binding protein YceI
MQNANEAVRRTEAAPGGGAVFVIDKRRSRFTVQAFATGLLSAMGHNPTIAIRTFSGEVEFDSDALRADRLWLKIQASSLAVLDDISDKDRREIESLMKSNVLEIEKYPEICFEAHSPVAVNRIDASLYSATLNGNLNLHGVTRGESIPVRIVSMGEEMLRASGEFTLKQSDYQIKPVSVAGGALKLKDELKFSFEMVANKRDQN